MKPNEIILHLNSNIKLFKNLLADISPDEIIFKPSEDKWSLLEIVCHLNDEEKDDFKPRLEKILRQDSEWKSIDPQGWVISRKYAEKDFTKTLDNFFEERKKSVEWLNSLKIKDWNVKVVHPKLGEFTAFQMLANWLAHDYLHMRQIIKLKYQILGSDLNENELRYAGDW